MSTTYEAIVLAGDESAARAAFNGLRTPLSLGLLQHSVGGFVISCDEESSGRVFAVQEVNRLAAEMSARVGIALAAHYDDRCGVKAASLFREGAFVREFGEADEVWAPVDEQGEPNLDGPRYPGNALPADEECDCIRQAIDAGLQSAGFNGWVSASSLREAIRSRKDWLAEHRP
jgi:hypothetical protein